MSIETDPLPNPPQYAPPVDTITGKFSQAWSAWILVLYRKVNVINSTLANLSAVVSSGVVSSNGTGTFISRTITGTAGNVSVVNGTGISGNPTIDLIVTGIAAGTYERVTVDTFGRATAGSNTPAAPLSSTVAALGTATLALRSFATDSTVTTTAGIGAIVVGGGANGVPVYADGTNWRIG